MLQQEKFNKGNNIFVGLNDKINNSLPDEINIYNQAFLINSIPLTPSRSKRIQTSHEYPKCFNLSGDLTGQVICYIDTYNKTVKDLSELLSIFQESFNILIGRTLSNLMSTYSINSLIGAPTDRQTLKIKSNENLSTGYKLIHNFQEFNCTVIFQIDRI